MTVRSGQRNRRQQAKTNNATVEGQTSKNEGNWEKRSLNKFLTKYYSYNLREKAQLIKCFAFLVGSISLFHIRKPLPV